MKGILKFAINVLLCSVGAMLIGSGKHDIIKVVLAIYFIKYIIDCLTQDKDNLIKSIKYTAENDLNPMSVKLSDFILTAIMFIVCILYAVSTKELTLALADIFSINIIENVSVVNLYILMNSLSFLSQSRIIINTILGIKSYFTKEVK